MNTQTLKIATRALVVAPVLSLFAACNYMPDLKGVLPDRKNEYKKSESLPDLEIPPDLTAGAANDSMNIPDETPVTLSGYKNPRAPGGGGAPVNTGTTETDEQWLSLPGPKEEFWAELKVFFEAKDYSLEVDDQELGVLETGWSQADEQAGLLNRYKYKVFSEPGDSPDSTVLFISQQRQTRLEDGSEWVDQERDPDTEKQLVVELRSSLGADRAAADTAPAAARETDSPSRTGADRDLPRVVDVGDGKLYLAIPEEFELAWKNTETALQNAGVQVTGKDTEKNLYTIQYPPAGEAVKKRGFFSRLAFWKGDGTGSYQLSLTGVGNSTELIVLNAKGEWEITDEAARILALVQTRYPSE